MRASDILIRSVAAIVVLGCGVFFVFGLAVAAAADQHGTTIHHNEPATLPMLWHEASIIELGPVLDAAGILYLVACSLYFGPGSPRSEVARRPRDCKQDGSVTA